VKETVSGGARVVQWGVDSKGKVQHTAHLLVFIQVLHKVQVSHSCTLFLVDLLGFECD